MKEIYKPIIVEFPLRGEWLAPNTPGKKIPSHGTDQLGTRYAYDFLQVDWKRKGWPSYGAHWLRYLLIGVPLNECYCWGQEVYAPCDGVIVRAEDGYKERARAHLLSDLFVALKSAYAFNLRKDTIQSVAGNYIIMKCSNDVYAGLVHLQKGSIRVSIGQSVKKGDVIGKVGHSGNSFSPHLHFQLMDSSDILSARGLPCAFEQYESFKDGEWRKVYNGIPTDKDHIRFCAS
ncbi:M23 family metallopeptidase [Desulfosporosinus shakirovi]|uniref:M23 family metallopeptidase n=1 Tax=Desulfosporosinus shakirovi TaxID=2885154 RepID=UPI001E335117|nr:M23 family metallopeptidase [Desulfosporosinus sp. SRJS8]MCB8815343.1 M23 family metallopeptidase [Desulfosporosinus sp. SRJS8]